jgi:aminoglycoside 3-N-acetyltransferase
MALGEMAMLQKTDLVNGIKACGVERGMLLVLHSSMKSMGFVEGGPEAVVEAFLEVLGPDGTLMVPTFTYGPNHSGKPFDPVSSPSATGLISETLRRRPDAVRSIAPIHSVAAVGKHADELTRDHLYVPTLGRDAPFHRAALMGGYIILLGCGHTSNSMIHVAESLAELSYIYTPSPTAPTSFLEIRQPDGRVKQVQLTEFTGCSKGFFRAEAPLRQAAVIHDGKIGQARVQLVNAAKLLDVLTPLIKQDPTWLLCEKRTCEYCVPRREVANNEFKG